jgi:hypothetical protein
MTTFRPSARVRLTLRTEEFDDTALLESRLPPAESDLETSPSAIQAAAEAPTPANSSEAATLLAENQNRRRALELERSSLPSEVYQQQVAQLEAEREAILSASSSSVEATTPPESVAGSATDDLTVLGDIEPISLQIERNGLATADTATAVIDYTDAPIDPQILRAAHVELILGVVTASEYEDGMETSTRRSDGSLTSLVEAPGEGSLTGVTRFVGFVDTWGTSYSMEGDTISMDCRDMSAQLRDLRLNPGESIDLTLPIDEGVSAFLDSVSATSRGIEVTYLGDGDPPTPANAAPTTRRRARRGRVARRARRGNEEMSVWDHITDVVRGLGLLPVTSDYALQITEPRTLTSDTSQVKRMVFGRNLESLEFNRKLSGVKVPTIEARSYDQDRGRTLWARYPVRSGERASGVLGIDNPPRPLRANEVPPSGSNPDEGIRVLVVSGVTDLELLERIAQNAFDQLGRQEIEGSFSTFDTWSYESAPNISDLLRLKSGDAVEILISSSDTPEDEEFGTNVTRARLQAMDRARRADYLRSLGWDSAVAERFAALQDATGFQTIFRVQDVRISWDRESGFKLSCSFINFVTVREESAAE